MKKKIGILTFHRAINYGGILQCFALYKYLQKKGYDVDAIDYRPDYIEKWRKAFSFYNRRFISLIKSIIKGCLFYPYIRKSNRNFDQVLGKMSLSCLVKNEADFDKLNYDYYFCGSDQIWNPRITYGTDPIFFGNFNRKGAKIVSYAASMGEHNLGNGLSDNINMLLKSIDNISVREDDLCSLLRKSGLDAKVVVDPTILADRAIFDELIEEPSFSNYVLVYALKDELMAVNFAKQIAEQLHSEVIVLRAIKSGVKYKEKNIRTIECVSPGAFIGFIKKSICNVIVSFHGTVFSTLYNKDFYSLQHSTQGRYEHYLKNVGLESRLVNPLDKIIFSHVDYSSFETKIQDLRKDSVSFIDSSLHTDIYGKQ